MVDGESNGRQRSGPRDARPQLYQMQSAVNRDPKEIMARRRLEKPTEDDLLESLENIDMLLSNMQAGAKNKETAIQKLG